MSTDSAQKRRQRALRYVLIAGVMAAIAAVAVGIEYRAARPDSAAGLLLPGIGETIATGQRVTITSAEASYRIERTERGEQTVWVMRDRGDYPVLASRLTQLTEGLRTLRTTRRMTNDPDKHARLGVDDPRQGGRGVLVQIEDGRGALLVNLILGVEPTGLYVRRPDDDQAWAAEGVLPPLRDVAAWLDLRPIALEPDALARVEIIPAEGRAYILGRDDSEGAWRIAVPALAPLSAATVRAAAERITTIAPRDVQPAPAIQGPVTARVRATTFDGLAIDAEIIEADGRLWMKLVARPSAPEHEAAALALNNHAAAWAYGLSEQDARALAPPLISLVPGAN